MQNILDTGTHTISIPNGATVTSANPNKRVSASKVLDTLPKPTLRKLNKMVADGEPYSNDTDPASIKGDEALVILEMFQSKSFIYVYDPLFDEKMAILVAWTELGISQTHIDNIKAL